MEVGEAKEMGGGDVDVDVQGLKKERAKQVLALFESKREP